MVTWAAVLTVILPLLIGDGTVIFWDLTVDSRRVAAEYGSVGVGRAGFYVHYVRPALQACSPTEWVLRLGGLGEFRFRDRSVDKGTVRLTSLATPAWPWTAILTTYPAVALVTYLRGPCRRERRRKRNECLQCGYSLVGNTGGVCPECGHAVDQGNRLAEPGATRPAAPKRRVRLADMVVFTVLHVLVFRTAGTILGQRGQGAGLVTNLIANIEGILIMMAPGFAYLWTRLYLAWLDRRSPLKPR